MYMCLCRASVDGRTEQNPHRLYSLLKPTSSSLLLSLFRTFPPPIHLYFWWRKMLARGNFFSPTVESTIHIGLQEMCVCVCVCVSFRKKGIKEKRGCGQVPFQFLRHQMQLQHQLELQLNRTTTQLSTVTETWPGDVLQEFTHLAHVQIQTQKVCNLFDHSTSQGLLFWNLCIWWYWHGRSQNGQHTHPMYVIAHRCEWNSCFTWEKVTRVRNPVSTMDRNMPVVHLFGLAVMQWLFLLFIKFGVWRWPWHTRAQARWEVGVSPFQDSLIQTLKVEGHQQRISCAPLLVALVSVHRVFLSFQALGCMYFIHQSVQNVQIWDFKDNTFVHVHGREVCTVNTFCSRNSQLSEPKCRGKPRQTFSIFAVERPNHSNSEVLLFSLFQAEIELCNRIWFALTLTAKYQMSRELAFPPPFLCCELKNVEESLIADIVTQKMKKRKRKNEETPLDCFLCFSS